MGWVSLEVFLIWTRVPVTIGRSGTANVVDPRLSSVSPFGLAASGPAGPPSRKTKHSDLGSNGRMSAIGLTIGET